MVGGLWAAFSFVDFYIREAETSSLRQQWFAGEFGEGVGETVTKIEGRWVAALSVFAPGGAGNVGLFGVYGYDLEIGTNHEEIELAAGSVSLPSF